MNYLIISAGSFLTPSNLFVSCSPVLLWPEENLPKLSTTAIVILFFCSVTCSFCSFFFSLFRLTDEATICWSTSSIIISPAYLNHPACSVCLRICSKWLRWFPKGCPKRSSFDLHLHFHYCLQNYKGPTQVLLFEFFLKEIMLRTSHCLNASDAQGCW